jgi:hypothetical protein
MISAVVPFLAFAIAAGGHSPAAPPAAGRPPLVEGYWQPGGYEGRIGSPYFYSVPVGAYSLGWHANGCDCGRPFAGGYHGFHAANAVAFGYGWRAYDPYTYHFGPGYYRYAEHGHFRFPYYSYRRPWYHPGPPVFNRDTNFAW